MKAFTIDSDSNNITVHDSLAAARTSSAETGAGVFSNEVEFADLIGPDSKRLVKIWNSLTGVTPVTKFKDRKTATERIWREIHKLAEPAATEAAPAGKKAKRAPKAKSKAAKATKTPKAAKKAPKPAGSGPREISKTAQLIEMLKRPKGATLEEVMAKFGWQIHTTRAIMSAGGSLTKKHGLTVISEKVGDSRTYRIAK
jgi:hypothetical protein